MKIRHAIVLVPLLAQACAMGHTNYRDYVKLRNGEVLQRTSRLAGDVLEVVVMQEVSLLGNTCWASSRTTLIDLSDGSVINAPDSDEATIFGVDPGKCETREVIGKHGIKTTNGLVSKASAVADVILRTLEEHKSLASMCDAGSDVDAEVGTGSLRVTEVFEQGAHKFVAEAASDESFDLFVNFYVIEDHSTFFVEKVACRSGLET